MAFNTPNTTALEGQIRRTLHEHWGLFLIQGLVLVALGAAAIALPQFASVAVSAVVGWVLFIAGVSRLVTLLRSRHMNGFWMALVLAVVTAILGVVLALFPIQGAQTLTLALVAYFVVHGIASFSRGFSVRDHSSRWVLFVVSGIVDFVLAGLTVASLQDGRVSWILGLYVGINLLLSGFALVFASLGARSREPSSHQV